MEMTPVLPVEIWAQVFGYLTHTEKLVTRLVCQDWNNQISSDLGRNSYLSLETGEGRIVLLNSSVQWKNIKKVQNPIRDHLHHLGLPQSVISIITSLKLNIMGEHGITGLATAVLQFDTLKNLKVDLHHELSIPDTPMSDMYNRVDMNVYLGNLQLKSLSIKFPFNYYGLLTGFLGVIRSGSKCLTKLKIQEHWKDRHDADQINESRPLPLENILRIISNSSKTLISLKLDFCTRSVQNKLFPELVSKLNTINDLELEHILIRPDPTEGNIDRDFLIHQQFLKTQISATKVVKKIILPWCADAYLCQKFVQSLPQNIKFIGYIQKEHISENFQADFTNLNSLSISGRRELHVFRQPFPTVHKLSVYIRKEVNDHTQEEIETFYRVLGNALVNLTELNIDGNYEMDAFPFYDADLQLIIENFTKLRVLNLNEIGDNVTEFGITGIDDEYARELIETRRLYRCPEIPQEYVYGIPLCSLKLEKLILPCIDITDFTVYYGLQFGATLKHMTIRYSEQVSDWGLQCLGIGNPSLESFNGTLMGGCRTISNTGLEDLRKELRMVEHTRKFKLV